MATTQKTRAWLCAAGTLACTAMSMRTVRAMERAARMMWIMMVTMTMEKMDCGRLLGDLVAGSARVEVGAVEAGAMWLTMMQVGALRARGLLPSGLESC
jgi:hypothetical protein